MIAARYDLVVIGGGPGGQKAAVQGAKAGKRVLLVEREQSVGGECVRRGTIPSKSLGHSATVFLRWRHAFAERPSERCGSAMSALMRRKSQVTKGHEDYMSRQMAGNGIEVRRGIASFEDERTLRIRGIDGTVSSVTGDVIVIATGSRPRTPPDVPVDHENVLDSDSILVLPYLPESLTVLGAGVIAAEFASIFAALGVKVVMIDKGERPLAFLDAEITNRFVAEFERIGGRFLGKSSLAKVEYDGLSKVAVELESGERIESAKVLCALGRTAQVAGLDLAKAHLAVNARGVIPVDEHCRTAVPHIYAVGDVIGPPALAATSMEQGRRAVRHAFGLPEQQVSSTTPVGIYTIPELSSVGLSETEVRAKHGGAVIGRARFAELARGVINGDSHGLLKLVCDPRGRRLLGAQIAGEGATELIHVAQMAITTEQDVDVFLDNILNFPTLAEGYLVAALDVLEQRGALERKAA
jgi:NAD(P) transhydrogenase